MKTSRYSEPQILAILRQAEGFGAFDALIHLFDLWPALARRALGRHHNAGRAHGSDRVRRHS